MSKRRPTACWTRKRNPLAGIGGEGKFPDLSTYRRWRRERPTGGVHCKWRDSLLVGWGGDPLAGVREAGWRGPQPVEGGGDTTGWSRMWRRRSCSTWRVSFALSTLDTNNDNIFVRLFVVTRYLTCKCTATELTNMPDIYASYMIIKQQLFYQPCFFNLASLLTVALSAKSKLYSFLTDIPWCVTRLFAHKFNHFDYYYIKKINSIAIIHSKNRYYVH